MSNPLAHIAARYGEELAEFAEDDVVRGVQIFKIGSNVHHPNGDFTVDTAFVRELMESWEALTADGYRPPVLAEHGKAGDGRIYGKVLRMYLESGGVAVDLELAAGVKEEWDAGYRGNVSPSIWKEFTHPHTGAELSNVLREVSMVSVPHLKNLKSVPGHYSLGESGFIESGEPTTATEADMADKDSSVDETEIEMMEDEEPEYDMADIMSRLEAMEARFAEMEGEDEEDEEEMSEMSEQERRIAELETKLAMSEVRDDIPGVKDDEVADIARIKMMSESVYRGIVKARTAIDMSERGVVGSAASGAVTFAVAKERARAAGIAPGPATIEYIHSNFPSALK